jgi:excinuclease ABC subunit A
MIPPCPADVASAAAKRRLMQLDGLVASGNRGVVVEHDMEMVAGSDWIIDIGPGAGDEGGDVGAAGPPEQIVAVRESRTATYLAQALGLNR